MLNCIGRKEEILNSRKEGMLKMKPLPSPDKRLINFLSDLFIQFTSRNQPKYNVTNA